MFQFTTTHVINNVKDVIFVNQLKSKNIVEICKAAYEEPVNEVLSVDFSQVSDAVEGDTLRLSLYIRLTASDNNSAYANDTQYKGRPLTIEFPWMADAASTLKNLEKIINKYGVMIAGQKIVNVSIEDEKLVLSAVNEYQRFYNCKLEKYVESSNPFAEVWKEEKGVMKVATAGVEGFGTYGWLLRNLKFPTVENTNAFAVKASEMPAPGAKYNQYTVKYSVQRDALGMNAVGQVVTSITDHVFYVNDAIAAEFEEALGKLGEITEVPEKAEVAE